MKPAFVSVCKLYLEIFMQFWINIYASANFPKALFWYFRLFAKSWSYISLKLNIWMYKCWLNRKEIIRHNQLRKDIGVSLKALIESMHGNACFCFSMTLGVIVTLLLSILNCLIWYQFYCLAHLFIEVCVCNVSVFSGSWLTLLIKQSVQRIAGCNVTRPALCVGGSANDLEWFMIMLFC